MLPGGEDVGRKGEAILSAGLTREKAELELRKISVPACHRNHRNIEIFQTSISSTSSSVIFSSSHTSRISDLLSSSSVSLMTMLVLIFDFGGC